jgi:excisionase family DNA binding protein
MVRMFEYLDMNIITIEEAARRKGVSKAAIYKAIQDGKLIKVKIVGVTEDSLKTYEPDSDMVSAGKHRKIKEKKR